MKTAYDGRAVVPNGDRIEPFPPAAERTPLISPALAGLSLSVLLASLGTSSANVALPELARAFDVHFQAVQWVVLAYLLATTTLVVSAGRLGDIAGRRRLLMTGLLLFAVASALCGAAPSLWLLVAARAAQGIGAAFMLALALAFVGDAVPPERTGSAMGLLGTMSAVGTALGPSLAGLLIAALGWRTLFLVNLPLAVTALLLTARHLPADRPMATAPRSFDAPGTLLLALTLGAYALAMTIGRGSLGPLNVALLLAAGGGAALFAFVETRSGSPLISLAMLRDPALRAGLATSALVSTVMMATLVVGPFYLSRSLGLGAALTGGVMSAGPLVVAFTGVPAGRAVDRFGARPVAALGLVAMGVGCATLAATPAAFGVPGYLAPIVLLTLGYALFQTANNAGVMATIRREDRGVVSGMLNLSRNLGLITGASVMGALFAFAAGASDLDLARPRDVATGMRVTFAVAASLIAIALAIALRNRTRPATDAALAAAPDATA